MSCAEIEEVEEGNFYVSLDKSSCVKDCGVGKFGKEGECITANCGFGYKTESDSPQKHKKCVKLSEEEMKKKF